MSRHDDYIADAGFKALVTAAEEKLGRFAAQDGRVQFAASAHIVIWTQN